jgi:hypothetical protein
METGFLNKNFDYTQTLINANPQNEDLYIANYNKLILQTKNNSHFVRTATYRDSDNTPNIKIMNNFQRYGTDNLEQPIFIPTNPTIITGNVVPPTSSNLIPPVVPPTSSNLTPPVVPPTSSNLTPPVVPPTSSNLGTQSFTNKETFQNYYNNFINGGFKEYFHI